VRKESIVRKGSRRGEWMNKRPSWMPRDKERNTVIGVAVEKLENVEKASVVLDWSVQLARAN